MTVDREQQGIEFRKLRKEKQWNKSQSKLSMTHAELMDISFPPNRWTVDGLIPAEGITILSAPPGSYKTWLLLHIITAVASGQKVLGEFSTEPSSVLVIDEENGPRLIQDRLSYLNVGDNLNIHYRFNTDFIADTKKINQVIEFCQSESIKFVTIDSLIRIHSGNENDAGEMAKVFKQLRKFTNNGISLLLTHHNRKSGANSGVGSQEMRGSSDILAALDCHLSLVRDDDRLKLSQNKIRTTEELEPLDISIKKDGELVKFVFEGTLKLAENRRKTIRSSVVEVLDEYGSGNQNEILVRLKEKGIATSVNTLRDALNQLINDETITKDKGERNSYIFKLTI